MLPLISVVLVILGALGLKRLLPRIRKRRQQVRFIRQTLAAKRTSDDRRVIASLSTVPDRINNLRPTIQSLLKQTRPPDEIILATPEFSVREQRGAAMPSTFDWDDAKMIQARDLREPRPVAVITGCGSYLVQPRFFDQSLWDYSRAPSVAFHIDDIWISDGSAVAV